MLNLRTQVATVPDCAPPYIDLILMTCSSSLLTAFRGHAAAGWNHRVASSINRTQASQQQERIRLDGITRYVLVWRRFFSLFPPAVSSVSGLEPGGSQAPDWLSRRFLAHRVARRDRV